MERSTNIERGDVAVIGGGVVGLAIGRELSQTGREVYVFESEKSLGMHSSSRNSEVIHSGIYYPKETLKADLCITGKELIYEYCEDNEINYQRLGKLLLATKEEEIPILEKLKKQAEKNGVNDLIWLEPSDIKRLEPALSAVFGLFSPSSGIVDSHGLMTSLKRDIERNKSLILLATPVTRGAIRDDGVMLSFGEKEETRALFRLVINSAGLWAQKVAGTIEGFPKDKIPPSYFAKGHYFTISGESPFSHLIYPVPEPGGLGIHVTLDMARNARFGPDVSWVDGVEYGFDEGRAKLFYESIRKYYPSLKEGSLTPGYTGIRPKLGPEGSGPQDFVIQGPKEHGIIGLVNLYGIESPGLTASLAIAEKVAKILK